MDKYAYILDTLKEGDEYIQILCANTEVYNHRPIKDDSELTEKMMGLNRYFNH